MERISESISVHRNIHVFGGILGSTGSESVQAEGIFIVFALIVVVFSAGVELAENQLPVIALFFFVVVDRDPAAAVLDLNGFVKEAGDDDFFSEAFSCFIN